jgi:hypothetical protein
MAVQPVTGTLQPVWSLSRRARFRRARCGYVRAARQSERCVFGLGNAYHKPFQENLLVGEDGLAKSHPEFQANHRSAWGVVRCSEGKEKRRRVGSARDRPSESRSGRKSRIVMQRIRVTDTRGKIGYAVLRQHHGPRKSFMRKRTHRVSPVYRCRITLAQQGGLVTSPRSAFPATGRNGFCSVLPLAVLATCEIHADPSQRQEAWRVSSTS